MDRDPATYESIRDRYDEWIHIRSSKPLVARPSRAALAPTSTPEPAPASTMGKTVLMAIGVGIGALLLLLAVVAFVVAGFWGGLDRAGAQVGYLVVGAFLVIAGVGGILATLNHNLRVLSPHRARHASH